jgi:hypothetical protein
MTLFTAGTITALFDKNKKLAEAKLRELSFFCDGSSSFGGLNGWVFEQTIQHCLTKELRAIGIAKPKFNEQIALGGRAKADLAIGKVAIEIKSGGLFGKDEAERYRRYKRAARSLGMDYLFFSLGESHRPYRVAIVKALNPNNVFFLDEPKDWGRFVKRIARDLQGLNRSVTVGGSGLIAAGRTRG